MPIPRQILLISRCPPYPLHFGDRLVPYHLARELTKQGTDIDLLAYYAYDSDPYQLSHYASYFRSVRLVREPNRSMLSYLARLALPNRFFPTRGRVSWSAELWHLVGKLVQQKQYDIAVLFGGVHVYEFFKLVKHLPNLIIPYESYTLFLQRQLTQQPYDSMLKLQYWAACQYERRMFTPYDAVSVLTEVDAAMLHSLQPRLNVQVIPNGIDTIYFQPQPLPDGDQAPTLIFFGNLEYGPNADAAQFLIQEIFPLVQVKLPHARLIIVGNNPAATLLQQASPTMMIRGHVPDLRPYIARAHVFISPLRFGAGIKNKVLEAMAMGKPIVATPLSIDGIDVLDPVHVRLGTTAAELAQAAIEVLSNSALQAAMGQANRALIESRYAWTEIVTRYADLMTAIIQRRAHH